MTEQPAMDSHLQPWTPGDRESFFAAIERHRRAARRVAWVARACAFALAFVVAVLMSPLCYGILGLIFDLVSRLLPTPDLIGIVMDTVGNLIDDPGALTSGRWLYLALIAAMPGLCIMALAQRTLRRLMCEAMGGTSPAFPARPPDFAVLAEQRFANVVEEMAVAAALSPPRVLVTDCESPNAAVFGPDNTHATVVISTGLLATANRAELQGVSGHLVGSIANGDMAIGTGVAVLLGLFGLIARLTQSFGDATAARRFWRLLRASLQRGGSTADGEIAMAITNPFEPEKPGAPLQESPDLSMDGSNRIPWRTLAWMPLAGPLVFSGFLGGMLCTFVLGPLLALSWRQRKYLADASAVRLARDPDALAGALEKMRGMPVDGAFGAWIAHLSVMPSGLIGAKSILGASSVPMSPSLDRRLKALGVMGAQVAPRRRIQISNWAWFGIVPLGCVLVALMSMALFLLLYVSVALSGLFTWLPVMLVHAIIR